jgi:hypothetical protein
MLHYSFFLVKTLLFHKVKCARLIYSCVPKQQRCGAREGEGVDITTFFKMLNKAGKPA